MCFVTNGMHLVGYRFALCVMPSHLLACLSACLSVLFDSSRWRITIPKFEFYHAVRVCEACNTEILTEELDCSSGAE
jgi:hypothetical protein